MLDYHSPDTTGTEAYHGYVFVKGAPRLFAYTDSIVEHAEKFKAWWTLDVVASYIPTLKKWGEEHDGNTFYVLTFDVDEGKCKFMAREDISTEDPEAFPAIVSQDIEYTDLPHSLKLYLVDGVLMFPGDY